MRILKSSLACVLILSAGSLAFGDETYTGTITHSPSGMSSDIYLRKHEDRGSLKFLRDMIEMKNAIDANRYERERIEIERERLRLQKERNEIEKKRLEEELRKAREGEIQSGQNKSYGSESSQEPTGSGRTPSISYPQPPSSPFKVYFKTGGELLCDQAWRDGNNIFLVVHGKKYAMSYGDSEIDLEKSFR